MLAANVDKLKYLLRSAWIVFRRGQMSRTTSEVIREYGIGWERYKLFLDEADTLDKWLRIPGVEGVAGYYNIDGRLVYRDFDSSNFYRTLLADAIRRLFPNFKSITEFGCGVGRNLLFLKKEFPHATCFGYELCDSGIAVARRAASKFGVDVTYAQLDYVEDGPNKYVHPATDVAFTMFSLEQIPVKNAQALANIVDRVKMGSIHIEPVPENYPMTLRGVLGRMEHSKVAYLSGFDVTAHSVTSCECLVEGVRSAHNPLMFPSLYVLRKKFTDR